MTTFGVIGDLHGHCRSYETVIGLLAAEGVDGVLLVGDFASSRWERESRGSELEIAALEEEIRFLVTCLQSRVDAPVAWVPGNHDLREVDGPGATDRRLTEIDGVRIWGVGGAGPARFGFPYEWSEAEIAALEAPECDVLLCHAPPRGTLDRTVSGVPVGSRSIRSLAHRVPVVVCGHIHEAGGVARLGDALCLNAGSLGEPFARAQVGFVRFLDEEVEVEHRTLDDGRRRVLRRPRRSGGRPRAGRSSLVVASS